MQSNCFICLTHVEDGKKKGKSFRALGRFLTLPLDRIETFCKKCATAMIKATELVQVLEIIQMELDYWLGQVSNSLEASQGSTDNDKGYNLRNKLLKKCSRKFLQLKPTVKIKTLITAPSQETGELINNDNLQQITNHYSLFECNKCHKTFKFRANLRLHFRKGCSISNNKKTNRCVKCGKNFACAKSLQTHQENLHGQRLPCPNCMLSFVNESQLARHQERMHQGKFYCKVPDCDYKINFQNAIGLHQHFVNVHNVPKALMIRHRATSNKLIDNQVPIEMDSESDTSAYSPSPSELEDAMEEAQVPLATKVPQNEPNLHNRTREEISMDFEKMFLSKGQRKCNKCNEIFTTAQDLKSHYDAVHLGNSYKCKECYKEFKSQHYLRCHQRKSHNQSLNFGEDQTVNKKTELSRITPENNPAIPIPELKVEPRNQLKTESDQIDEDFGEMGGIYLGI